MLTADERDEMASIRRRRDALDVEVRGLRAREHELDDGERIRLDNLQRGLDKMWDRYNVLHAKFSDDMLEGVRTGRYSMVDAVDTGEPATPPVQLEAARSPFFSPADRDRALRAIESLEGRGMSPMAGDRLERIVREDTDGPETRYIAAVSSPEYEAAFWSVVTDPNGLRTMPEPQREAVRRVRFALEERALTVGTEGQLAVPATIDPTIMLTSDGAVNPLRAISRVETITSHTWKGVASAGVTASFDAELAEVSDDTPSLTQPEITPEKAQAFIEFSVELGQDWGQLRAEMTRLLTDAKDTLEASVFVGGTGVPTEPEGVIAGLGTAYQVSSVGTAVIAADDVYALKQALPPRFQPGAAFCANGAILDAVYRMVPVASADEPPLMSADGSRILRKPAFEVSSMTGTTASADKVLLYGDLKAGYVIVDRVGLSVELVPLLLGDNHRPKGSRGLYAYWRVGAGIVNPAALRLLVVT